MYTTHWEEMRCATYTQRPSNCVDLWPSSMVPWARSLHIDWLQRWSCQFNSLPKWDWLGTIIQWALEYQMEPYTGKTHGRWRHSRQITTRRPMECCHPPRTLGHVAWAMGLSQCGCPRNRRRLETRSRGANLETTNEKCLCTAQSCRAKCGSHFQYLHGAKICKGCGLCAELVGNIRIVSSSKRHKGYKYCTSHQRGSILIHVLPAAHWRSRLGVGVRSLYSCVSWNFSGGSGVPCGLSILYPGIPQQHVN